MNTHLLEKLKASPDALLLINRFQHYMHEENKKREEFYNLVHENVSAEFINGEIVMHSPVRMGHLKLSNRVSNRLMNHVEKHDLGFVGVEKMMIQLSRNNYEPDIVFFRKEVAERFTDDQKLFPVPDLVVEILSDSTRANDYGIKYQDYEAHQVQEYWIIDPDAQTVEQFLLKEGSYYLATKLQAEGIIHAKAIEGFNLDLKGIF